MKHDIDHFDGHMLLTEWDVAPEFTPDPDVDELVHEVIHPPTCLTVEEYISDDETYDHHNCIPQMHHENCEWPEATTPGLRVIGYRVDTYTFNYSTEYDVIAFTVGGPCEATS